MNRQFRREFQAATRGKSWEEIVAAGKYASEVMWSPTFSDYEKGLSDRIVDEVIGSEFYHGGLLGREVGDYLLPAKITGQDPRGNLDALSNRTDHVFVTASLHEARHYKASSAGAVYLVEPDGIIGADENELRLAILLLETPRAKAVSRRFGKYAALGFTLRNCCKAIKCGRARVLAVLE